MWASIIERLSGREQTVVGPVEKVMIKSYWEFRGLTSTEGFTTKHAEIVVHGEYLYRRTHASDTFRKGQCYGGRSCCDSSVDCGNSLLSSPNLVVGLLGTSHCRQWPPALCILYPRAFQIITASSKSAHSSQTQTHPAPTRRPPPSPPQEESQ